MGSLYTHRSTKKFEVHLTIIMSLRIFNFQTLGNKCAQFKYPFSLSHFSVIYYQGSTVMVEDVGGLGLRVWEGVQETPIEKFEKA